MMDNENLRDILVNVSIQSIPYELKITKSSNDSISHLLELIHNLYLELRIFISYNKQHSDRYTYKTRCHIHMKPSLDR